MSVFKEFPGLENLEKNHGLSRTFKDPQEPCMLYPFQCKTHAGEINFVQESM